MSKLALILIVALSVVGEFAEATIDVAFFRFRDARGQLVQLEPGGEFAHIAIRVGSRWLHARPYAGVELVDDLRTIGSDWVVLVDDRAKQIAQSDIQKYLGLSYDSTFDWSDPDSSYCSKLVANILAIEPTAALFEAEHWRKRGIPTKADAVGISPDEIFHILRSRGFRPHGRKTCEDLFREGH